MSFTSLAISKSLTTGYIVGAQEMFIDVAPAFSPVSYLTNLFPLTSSSTQ